MRRPPNLLADKPAAPQTARPAEAAPPANYVELYGLSKPPFGGPSEGRGYILFNSHRRAFELTVDHILNGHGAVLLVGSEGVGKTEMLRAAADVAQESGHPVVRLFRPEGGRLMRAEVLSALGVHESATPADVVQAVLAPSRKAVVIDDFDLLPAEFLPYVRALMEPREPAETGPSLVLAASVDSHRPEVSQLLTQLRNTIRLIPLNPAEVRQYIERSLWVAGGTTRRLIDSDAIRHVVAQSGGVPGTINRLMDAVLTTGFVRGDPMITTRTVTAAIGAASPRPRVRTPEPERDGVTGRALQIVGVGLFVVGAGLFTYKALHGRADSPATMAASSPAASKTPAPHGSAPPLAAPAPSAPISPDLLAALIKRGDQSLSLGDVTAARLFFQRAAEGGSGVAAVALGKTFDPNYVMPGSNPDPGRAAEWYRKAAALGDPTAPGLLQKLGGT